VRHCDRRSRAAQPPSARGSGPRNVAVVEGGRMQYGYKLSAEGFGPKENPDGFMDFFARELKPQLAG
jgi:hypothetical protein